MDKPGVSPGKLALGAVALALAAGVVAMAIYALRLRCEGFGCTGVGVLWVVWVAVYLVVFGICLLVRGVFARTSVFRQWLTRASVGLALLGIALLAYWQLGPAA